MLTGTLRAYPDLRSAVMTAISQSVVHQIVENLADERRIPERSCQRLQDFDPGAGGGDALAERDLHR